MTVKITVQFPEASVREFAEMRMAAAMESPPRTVVSSTERDQMILACRKWVEDNPPPVRVEVEFTPDEVLAMRRAWIQIEGSKVAITSARTKILDALPPED